MKSDIAKVVHLLFGRYYTENHLSCDHLRKQKIKHITFLLDTLGGGGAEKAMVNLANFISDKNIRIDLVILNAKGAFMELLSPKIKLFNLKRKRSRSALLEVVQYLRKEKPQILLSALDHINILASLGKLFSGFKGALILTVHAPPTATFLLDRSIYGFLFRALTKWSYKRAQVTVGVSNGIINDICYKFKLNREKFKCIYNGIITDDIKKMEIEKIKHEWFEDSQVPVVVSVGRLSKEKRFDLLIQAIKEINTTRVVRLLILGEGEERNQLQLLIAQLRLENLVQLGGFKSNPYPYMKRGHLFVLASDFEGLGNVLVEALNLGCRVLSTDCPVGPSEILADGKFGRLVPRNDQKALSEAILDEIKKNEEKSQVFLQLLDKHLCKFRIEKVSNEYLCLFEQLLQEQQLS